MQIIILLKQIYIRKRISVDPFIRLCKQIFDKIFIIQGGTVDNITRKKGSQPQKPVSVVVPPKYIGSYASILPCVIQVV